MRMAPRKNAAAPRRRKLRLARVTAGVAAACIALAAPVAVADPPALDITPHADITVEATSSSGATVNFTLDTSIPATVTCNPASGSGFGITTTTVSCTATDGTTTTPPTSFSVTVRDTTGPAVSVPGDMTLDATSGAGRDVTFSASANDAVDGGLSPSCTPSSGSTFPLGQTTVTCSATDNHSNTGSASFKVNVNLVDTTPPVLSLPGNQSASTPNPGGTTVSFSASANDNIAGNVPVSCLPSSGSTFPIGTTTVNCSASDGHGNTASGSFTVTVTLTDTTKPVVTVPPDITREAASGSGTAVTFSSTAQDNLDGALTPTCTPASGATFPLGQTTVTCSATDAHSNTGTASFKVNIVDNTPPVLSLPGNQSASTPNPGGTTVSFSASANDNIAGNVQLSCLPSSGSTFPIGTTTVNCSASDGHGNTASGSFTVTVTLTDTTKPVVTVPPDITREAASGSGTAVTFSSTAQDNLDGALTPTCTPASGATFPLGQTTVTCSATDAHSNTGTASFKVNIVDNTAPTVTVPADITREADLVRRRSRHVHCLCRRHRRRNIVGDVLTGLRLDVRGRVEDSYMRGNGPPHEHRHEIIHRQSSRHHRSDGLGAVRSDARGEWPRRRARDVHGFGDRQRRRAHQGHPLHTRVGVAVPTREDHRHLQRVGHQWERGSCLIRSHRRRQDGAAPERPDGDHDDQPDLTTCQ